MSWCEVATAASRNSVGQMGFGLRRQRRQRRVRALDATIHGGRFSVGHENSFVSDIDLRRQVLRATTLRLL